jgi:hypothetical protein
MKTIKYNIIQPKLRAYRRLGTFGLVIPWLASSLPYYIPIPKNIIINN